MRIQDDPARRCWKIEEWPSIDQAAWETANTSAGLLTKDGLAAHWRAETRHKNRKGYGFWLHWLARNGQLSPVAAPAERVTIETVRKYLADLQSMVSAYTVRNRIAELLAVMLVVASDCDWSWLRSTLQRLDARVQPNRNKQPLLRPSRDFLRWATSTMRVLETSEKPGVRAALAHRDALMIAFLASRALRRGNLAAIEIGRHLLPIGDGFQIPFQGAETKNGYMLEQTVPEELAEHLRQHLHRFRPLLLKDKITNRLWLSWTGRPMTGMDVYHRVTIVTKRAFGIAISPHIFRDCLATSIATEAPEQIGIVRPMLNHRSSRTYQKHYNQAQSLETGRAYNQLITSMRKRIRRDRARHTPSSANEG
jgi:integrase